ncbi:MAG: biopolymer transporter ExbD [Myxococcales bacterium]|nr:biopolymer transporter ExbD [Myxococcales bacterium]MCB9708867.1 biopolymer transporter ExbD [Myxococcales bacterium]
MAELTPRQRLYVRKRTKVVELDPSEVAGELNIIPFLDVVVNIIMFLLATTISAIVISQIDAQLPTLSISAGRASGTDSALNLSVTITEAGVVVAGSGGKLAPGCAVTALGAIITVPKRNGRYDWKGLSQCVARVKAEPRFADETQVIVTANPLIEYEHVVNAMDAVRGDKQQVLFPDVLLSAGVR